MTTRKTLAALHVFTKQRSHNRRELHLGDIVPEAERVASVPAGSQLQVLGETKRGAIVYVEVATDEISGPGMVASSALAVMIEKGLMERLSA